MKLARISHNEAIRIAVIEDGSAFPVDELADGDMADLIERWAELEPLAKRAKASANGIALDEIKLLAPIGNPGKILAMGLNYADHISETKAAPDEQTWFAKMTSALNGPFDPIEIPKVSQSVDYEAELVVVIGKAGRHISRKAAPAHVFGYCCGNDVSVRDWQFASSQWITGKSFDTHAPIGPWITTSEDVPDPHALNIRCLVNGETLQSANTRQMMHDVWALIERLSQAMTLHPGDLIFTGTPGGVGFTRKPPRWLVAGDTVRIEIERLGAIEALCRNETIVRSPA